MQSETRRELKLYTGIQSPLKIHQNVLSLCCFSEYFGFIWIIVSMFLKQGVVRGTSLVVDDTRPSSSQEVYITAIVQV